MEKTKKIQALDMTKALGAILVIIIHITATPAVVLKEGALLPIIGINRFALPAVPLFIFASGMALTYAYRDKPFQLGSFLGRRFTKILIPYLVWCVVYFYYCVGKGYYPEELSFFLEKAWSGELLYHLYFVVIIMQFYLLFWGFLAITRHFPGKLVLPAGLLVNLAAVRLLAPENTDRCFLTYLVFFLVGCYFGKDPQKAQTLLKKLFAPVTVGFLLFGGAYCWRFYQEQVLEDHSGSGMDLTIYVLFCLFGILFYYGVAELLGKLPSTRAGAVAYRLLLWLSAGSFYVYLSHPLVILYAEEWAPLLGVTGTLDQMVFTFLLIFVTAVPLSIAYALGKSALRKRWKTGKKGV